MENKNNNVSELEQLRAQVKDLQEQAKRQIPILHTGGVDTAN